MSSGKISRNSIINPPGLDAAQDIANMTRTHGGLCGIWLTPVVWDTKDSAGWRPAFHPSPKDQPAYILTVLCRDGYTRRYNFSEKGEKAKRVLGSIVTQAKERAPVGADPVDLEERTIGGYSAWFERSAYVALSHLTPERRKDGDAPRAALFPHGKTCKHLDGIVFFPDIETMKNFVLWLGPEENFVTVGPPEQAYENGTMSPPYITHRIDRLYLDAMAVSLIESMDETGAVSRKLNVQICIAGRKFTSTIGLADNIISAAAMKAVTAKEELGTILHEDGPHRILMDLSRIDNVGKVEGQNPDCTVAIKITDGDGITLHFTDYTKAHQFRIKMCAFAGISAASPEDGPKKPEPQPTATIIRFPGQDGERGNVVPLRPVFQSGTPNRGERPVEPGSQGAEVVTLDSRRRPQPQPGG